MGTKHQSPLSEKERVRGIWSIAENSGGPKLKARGRRKEKIARGGASKSMSRKQTGLTGNGGFLKNQTKPKGATPISTKTKKNLVVVLGENRQVYCSS